MNSVPNSDSEQCTESRLGQVHSVHTPMAQATRTLRAELAMSWHTRRRVAGLLRSYRGLPLGCFVARTGHVSCCAACCVAARPHALPRVVSQASLAFSSAWPIVSWSCPTVSYPPPGVPRPLCLLNLFCACSACCVPTRPTVCLLSLLCATIQPAVL